MNELKLFMILIGCKPTGRQSEQHDVFFGIGETLADLKSGMNEFWPEVRNKMHVDALRIVKIVDQFEVKILPKNAPSGANEDDNMHLFFINLGGYKEAEFNEFHYKMIVAAENLDAAKKSARKNAFFKHYDLPKGPLNHGASSHIDDKYGIDVDDAYPIEDILPTALKGSYRIALYPVSTSIQDDIHLGYIRFTELDQFII